MRLLTMFVLWCFVFSLIGAEFAAAAVLISFGAVLGKVSSTQLLLMALIEIVLFQVNEKIVFYILQVTNLTCTVLPVVYE